jgi:catechol 2,3-dioxygenase-like lactoylglutathione lyase family enzyme
MKSALRPLIGTVVAAVMCTTPMGAQAPAREGFGGLEVTQIAFVVRDADAAARSWGALLGVEVPAAIVTDPLEQAHTAYRGAPTEARAKLAFVRLKNLTIELIEPIGGPSTWQEHLDAHGESVHHIAFNVADLPASIARAEQHGGTKVQSGDFTGGSYTYLDMPAPFNVMIELLTSGGDR